MGRARASAWGAALVAHTLALSACDGAGPSERGASTASAAAGTAGPTERWTEVASDVAPLLFGTGDDAPPPDFVRRGELLRVGASAAEATWQGALDGVPSRRDGGLFRARRSAAGTEMLAFQSDLGGEVTVSSTGALCDALAMRAPFELGACRSSLQRARAADGAIVSFVRCSTGACPLALERGGALGTMTLPNLASTFFVTGKKKSVLVAVTRFAKAEGKHSGGTALVVGLDGAEPSVIAEHPADEVDARDPERVRQRTVSIEVTRGEIRFEGTADERARDGTVTSSKRVEERHPLPALD